MATQQEKAKAAEVADLIRAGIADTRETIKREITDELLGSHGIYGAVNRPAMGDGGGGAHSRLILNRQTASWTGAPGRALDGTFDDFGSFVRGVSPQSLQVRGVPEAIRNLSSVDPSAGGFLVPEQFRSELLSIALDDTIVRSRATVIPMGSGKQVIPGIDATSNETSYFGGIVPEWLEEGESFTDTGPKFGRIMLEACKLGLRTDVPNELLADGVPALDVTLQSLFAQALAAAEDAAFLAGTGTGMPLGVLNSPALIVVDKEDGQIANTIVFENLIKMFARMLSRSRRRAVWVASDDTIPELMTLAISIGLGGSHVPVLTESNGQFNLLGRPIFFNEHVPVLGDQGDISLFDFTYYLIGDRGEMRMEASSHAKFITDETVFRAVERVDGRPWLNSAITPANGGLARSAFVTLGAR